MRHLTTNAALAAILAVPSPARGEECGVAEQAVTEAPAGDAGITVQQAIGAEKVAARETEGRVWTFDGDTAGEEPVGWTLGYTNPDAGEASWAVEASPRALSAPNILTLKTESPGPVFNLAMATGTSFRDVDVQAHLLPISGRDDQGGGVIWRCKDANNYYVCRFNPLENNFRIYKVVDGKRRTLQSSDLVTPAGTWYAVRARMVGDHITCYVDGKKLLDLRDSTFTEAGMVGLWTKADASSSFDNVSVRAVRSTSGEHQGETAGRTWTFDGEAAGEEPAAWKLDYTNPSEGQASWAVEASARALTAPNMLTLKTESPDQVFNLAIATGTSYRDVDIRAHVLPISGRDDQGGGVIWRCQDPNNYYVCRFNPLESNFRVYKVVDGRRRTLLSSDLVTPAGTWYAVRASMVGDHITCYVDGKKLLDLRDGTFTEAGMVGLWTKADASSSFDEVWVQTVHAAAAKHHDGKGG